MMDNINVKEVEVTDEQAREILRKNGFSPEFWTVEVVKVDNVREAVISPKNATDPSVAPTAVVVRLE